MVFSLQYVTAQIKYVLEDFEGLVDGKNDLNKNGIFTFGYADAEIKRQTSAIMQGPDFRGERFITASRKDKREFGGWGKGAGIFIELNQQTDYLNFYVNLHQAKNLSARIELQEDDNADGRYAVSDDDAWVCTRELKSASADTWQLVSIPLQKFTDSNVAGDGIFNCDYKHGKFLCFIICFVDPHSLGVKDNVSFDFISFSKGELPVNVNVADSGFCNLGFWSKEGNDANFTEIAVSFEKLFGKEKKLGVIHFFQPFAADGGIMQNLYPSVERVNKVMAQGYVPLITLENHFVNNSAKVKQPNLYSIVEGHMDNFFREWALHVKQMKGKVLVRILHEFNGSWYPWCIVNNDKNPELFVKAYRRIHDLFISQGVTNAFFIWCPNSMSVPQEPWNYIMDAYPGDEYVDLIGMDIYNGAEQPLVWRSFRKEGLENYFLCREKLSDKPIIVVETASRERDAAEQASGQSKADWIRQMSNCLKYDMNAIRLLTWFNEKSSFRLNSSESAKKAFAKYILGDLHFRSGKQILLASDE